MEESTTYRVAKKAFAAQCSRPERGGRAGGILHPVQMRGGDKDPGIRREGGGERKNGEYFYDLDATDIEDVDKNMEVSETLKLARIPNSGSQEDTPNKGRIHLVKRFVNDMDALPSQYGARESAEKTALKEHDALNQGGVSSEPLVRAKD